jgi:release factor glutamine methyltransferase
MPETIRDLLDETAKKLADAKIERPRHEAALLLSGILDMPLASVYAHAGQPADQRKAQKVHSGAERRARHVPLAYILGTAGFAGLSFLVGPGVLTPRPDSECLVEAGMAAVERLDECEPACVRKQNQMMPVKILDLGTGTGCIGISLAVWLKKRGRESKLTLTEKDPSAADYARHNLALHQLDSARLFVTDLFPPEHNQQYHLIVANPPYIPSDTIETLMPEVRCHEPHLALDGGADGLEVCRRIIKHAPDHLLPGGWLLLEHGFDQAEAVRDIFMATRRFDLISPIKDYGGHLRVSGGRLRAV